MFLSYTITRTLKNYHIAQEICCTHGCWGVFLASMGVSEVEVDSSIGVYFILVVTLPTMSPAGGCCAVSVVGFLGSALAFFLFLETSVDGKWVCHRTAPSALLLAVLWARSRGWAAMCIALLSQRLSLYLEHGSADHFLSASLVVGHGEGSSCIQPILNYNRNNIFFPFVSKDILKIGMEQFEIVNVHFSMGLLIVFLNESKPFS